MDLKEALIHTRRRYNEYGQDLEEVNHNAQQRWEESSRGERPKSYEEMNRHHL